MASGWVVRWGGRGINNLLHAVSEKIILGTYFFKCPTNIKCPTRDACLYMGGYLAPPDGYAAVTFRPITEIT